MTKPSQNPLAAGVAPLFWQRRMKSDVMRCMDSHLNTSWVESFISTRPALRDGSLLGNCFESILSGRRHTAKTENGDGRSRRRSVRSRSGFTRFSESRANESPPVQERHAPSVERAGKFCPRIEDAAPLPSGLPEHAEYHLLCRLAEVLSDMVKGKTERRSLSPAAMNKSVQHLLQRISDVESKRGVPEALPPPLEVCPETPEDAAHSWQDELARRIKCLISLANPQTETSAVTGDETQVWPWSQSVSGPTAPPELLDYLSHVSGQDLPTNTDDARNPPSSNDSSRERKAFSPAEKRGTSSLSAQQWSEASSARDSWSDVWSRGAPTPLDNLESVRDEGMIPPAHSRENAVGARGVQRRTDSSKTRTGRRASSSAENLLPGHDAEVKPSWSEFWEPLIPPEDNFDPRMEDAPSTSGWAKQIEPPVTAPQLPPLIPPQMIGMPVVPVATATIRREARAEEMADEDLDLLATRIQRILDEEARRHGIDV